MDQEHLYDIVVEILNYIESINDYSYYDLEAYAYSQKQEWIPAFKDKRIRAVIAECLKSRKRMAEATYRTPLYEALRRSTEAKYQYAVEYEKDFLDQIEANVEDSE